MGLKTIKEEKMKKYRKKPVVIEAIRIPLHRSEQQIMEVIGHIPGVYVEFGPSIGHRSKGGLCTADIRPWVIIPTLEGEVMASPGDYIIKGVEGEFYSCKSNIFDQTYEEVTDE